MFVVGVVVIDCTLTWNVAADADLAHMDLARLASGVQNFGGLRHPQVHGWHGIKPTRAGRIEIGLKMSAASVTDEQTRSAGLRDHRHRDRMILAVSIGPGSGLPRSFANPRRMASISAAGDVSAVQREAAG